MEELTRSVAGRSFRDLIAGLFGHCEVSNVWQLRKSGRNTTVAILNIIFDYGVAIIQNSPLLRPLKGPLGQPKPVQHRKVPKRIYTMYCLYVP